MSSNAMLLRDEHPAYDTYLFGYRVSTLDPENGRAVVELSVNEAAVAHAGSHNEAHVVWRQFGHALTRLRPYLASAFANCRRPRTIAVEQFSPPLFDVGGRSGAPWAAQFVGDPGDIVTINGEQVLPCFCEEAPAHFSAASAVGYQLIELDLEQGLLRLRMWGPQQPQRDEYADWAARTYWELGIAGNVLRAYLAARLRPQQRLRLMLVEDWPGGTTVAGWPPNKLLAGCVAEHVDIVGFSNGAGSYLIVKQPMLNSCESQQSLAKKLGMDISGCEQ